MTTLFDIAYELCSSEFPLGGNVLEFGVFEGRSFKSMVNYLFSDYQSSEFKSQTHVYGFDSFQGLPKEQSGIWCPERHTEGAYRSSRKIIDTYIKSKPESIRENLHVVEGWYSDTLTLDLQKQLGSCIFVNIDVDLYLSTIQVLDFIKPLIQKNTILYWDDWRNPQDNYKGEWGEHLAYKNWSIKNLDVKFETLSINEFNQRVMRVL